jgi:hypothetical protein
MKTRMLILIFGLFVFNGAVQAQFDDIYFNPSEKKASSKGISKSQQIQEDVYAYEEDDYAIEEDLSDYDYYYTARIRRFHRPLRGFNYFDPFYSDMWFYDPGMMMTMAPGVSLLIHTNPWSFNRFNRFSPWNSWDPFFNPWNSWGAFNNPWNRFGFGNPWAFGGMGFNTFNPYFGNWGFGGFMPTFGPGVVYNNNITVVDTKTYYGPRNSNNNYVPRVGENRRPQAVVPVSPRTRGNATTAETSIPSRRNSVSSPASPSPRSTTGYQRSSSNSIQRQRTPTQGTSIYNRSNVGSSQTRSSYGGTTRSIPNSGRSSSGYSDPSRTTTTPRTIQSAPQMRSSSSGGGSVRSGRGGGVPQ